MKKNFDIKVEVLEVIRVMSTRKGELRLQVVKWNDGEPKLELREYYKDKEENLQLGKLKGISYYELQDIEENLERIKKLMGAI